MALNVTELINYTYDIQYETNAKFLLLFIVTMFFVLGYIWSKNLNTKYYYQYLIKRVIGAICIPYFIMLPVYSCMAAFRTVRFDFFMNFYIVSFGTLITIFPLLFLFGGGERVLRFIFKILGKEEWMRINTK